MFPAQPPFPARHPRPGAEGDDEAQRPGEMTGDTLAQKFKQLESPGGAAADMALQELKAKMGLPPAGSTTKALPQKQASGDEKAPKNLPPKASEE